MNDILTVFQAEFMRRIQSRPFIAGLIIGTVAIFLMGRLPQIMTKATVAEVGTIVLVGDPALTDRAKPLLSKDYTVAAAVPAATDFRALLAQYKVGQAVQIGATPHGLNVTVYARDPANVEQGQIRRDLLPLNLAIAVHLPQARLTPALSMPVAVQSTGTRFANSTSAQAAHAAVFLMVFALYIVTLINSQLVMASVAEEKTSRIAEMLVAALDPAYLLVGKILASAALAFVQLACWIAFALSLNTLFPIAHSSPGSSDLPPVVDLQSMLHLITPGIIVLFVVLFLIGLLQLTMMFAGVAAMINRTEDMGSMTGPLIIPVVFALIAAITALDVPDAKWAVICSFIPIVSPFVLFARVAVSNIPPIEIVLALLVNLAALGLTAVACGKLYRIGMLLYGRSPSFIQIWRVLRS
jgi:ABC-2 type transport system permease protein